MKKIYLFFSLASVLGVGALSAQKSLPGPVEPTNRTLSTDWIRQKQNHEKAAVGEWLFFDDAYVDLVNTADIQTSFVNYLFPDSTILTNPSDPFSTWTHGIGQAYDLTSPVWTFNSNIDFTQPIKIDSILVWGWYDREDNSVDTLNIRLFTPSSTGNLWDVFYFEGATTQTNLGVDTAYFCDMEYDYTTNTITNPVWSHQIILDGAFFADSLDNGTHQHIIVPNNLTMTLNSNAFHRGLFAFTGEFRPGYTHMTTDIIGVDKNGFRFIAAELNGTDTYPTVTEKGDLTSAYLLEQDVRYNTAGGWNGSMINSLAYTNTYGWEYVYIVPFISQVNNVGVEEQPLTSQLQIFPNPASDRINLQFTAETSADAVVTITDLGGRVIRTFTNLSVVQGNNNLVLDVTGMADGSYIASLVSGGQTINSRLLIAR